MKTIGIAIATFGDSEWEERAESAVESALRTSADNVVHVHGTYLHSARNDAAEQLGTDYLIFLDADDMVNPDYVDVLRSHIKEDENLLYQPATIGLYPNGEWDEISMVIPDRGIFTANNLVIGTACSAEEFFKVEGFEKYDALEDWALFLKLIINGAKVYPIAEMIYIVGVWPTSRNLNTDAHHNAYMKITNRFRDYRGLVEDYYYETQ